MIVRVYKYEEFCRLLLDSIIESSCMVYILK